MTEWDAYWDALCRKDRRAALEAVRHAHDRGVGPLEIIDRLVVPAQARAGELWMDGRWTVEQEQAATDINEGLVHWLGSFAPPAEPADPLVVVTCIGSERHALPALVIAEALGFAGFRVHYVGGDPEPADLLRQVLVLKPRAVLLSASLTSSLATQKPLLAEIRAIGIPTIVGGQAFGGDERRACALGATAFASSLEEAVDLLRCLPERLTPVPRPEETPADIEAAWINEFRHEITPYVVRALARPSSDAEPAWWGELAEHVDHLLGCLAASLVTGDETIMVEVRDWLERLLARRGAGPDLVREIWDLVAEPLRGHPLARVHLAGAAPPVGPPAGQSRSQDGGRTGNRLAGEDGGLTDGLAPA